MFLHLVPAALAFTLSGEAIPPARFPLEVHWTGALRGFTQDEARAAVEGAASAWVAASSCEVVVTLVRDPEAQRWYESGGVAVLLGDPQDELAEGVLSVRTSVPSAGPAFERNGMEFVDPGAVRIVLNDGVAWATDPDIAAGACTDGLSAQGLLTHELGHVLGLGDSCAMGEACTDTDASLASMYPSLAACDATRSTLGTDDIAGIAAIYGAPPAIAFGCTAEDADTAITCAITEPSDAATRSPTWDFGDGSGAAGSDAVAHAYATPGTYDVRVCLELPGCGAPRCVTQSVAVGAAPGDTGAAGGDTAGGGADAEDTGSAASGGCAAAGGESSLALLALLAACGLRVARASRPQTP